MKILFLIDNFSYVGGTERLLSRWSNGMSNIEHDIITIFSDESYSEGRDITYWSHKAKTVTELNFDRPESKGKQLLTVLKAAKIVKKIRKEKKYDYVISCGLLSNSVNGYSRTKIDKTIMSMHITRQYKARTKILYPLSKADGIFTVSKGLEYEIKRAFSFKNTIVRTIFNGLELPTNVSPKQHPTGTIKIASVGRLSHQKGHWHAIHIIKQLIDQNYDVVLNHYGDGEYFNDLKQLASNLYIEDRIIFNGQTSNVLDKLKENDLFIMTSFGEGLPLVVAEAMSVGLPVVSVDFKHGIRDYLMEEYNELPVENPPKFLEYGVLCSKLFDDTPLSLNESNRAIHQEMANGFIKLIDSKELYEKYSNASINRSKRFTIEENVDEILEFIKSI